MKTLRVPLLLFALPALVIAFAPPRLPLLLLERRGLFAGEIWRLWTGHWVHFSLPHLTWNLAALVAAGAWLERARPGWLLRHTLVAAPLLSLALILLEPAMHAYGGLSGLATSVVTLLALEQAHARRADRPLWIALLLLVAGKILAEAGQDTTFFTGFASPAVRPARWAHAAGALLGLGLWPWWRRLDRDGVAPGLEMTPPGPVTDSRRQGSGNYP